MKARTRAPEAAASEAALPSLKGKATLAPNLAMATNAGTTRMNPSTLKRAEYDYVYKKHNGLVYGDT